MGTVQRKKQESRKYYSPKAAISEQSVSENLKNAGILYIVKDSCCGYYTFARNNYEMRFFEMGYEDDFDVLAWIHDQDSERPMDDWDDDDDDEYEDYEDADEYEDDEYEDDDDTDDGNNTESEGMNRTYFPGTEFRSCDLYRAICISMIEENRIEIERTIINGRTVYRWTYPETDHGITVRQLAECMNTGDEDNDVMIQIVFQRDDWERFDTVRVTSPMLMWYYDEKIDCIGVENGVIRIGLIG